MSLFVDTSALYALLVATEAESAAIAVAFTGALDAGRVLTTTNYVLIESAALLQRRFGVEAVYDLEERVVPTLNVHWVRADTHRRGVDLLRRVDRGDLSLVDCVSFVVMRSEGIREALALDDDFAAQGFRLVP